MTVETVTTKRIKINHRGPIWAKSGVYGPITMPYVEDVNTIGRMVRDDLKVVEVLEDGKEINLDIHNFNKVNTAGPTAEQIAAEKAAKEEAEREERELAELIKREEEEKQRQTAAEADKKKQQNQKNNVKPEDLTEK